MNKIIKRPEYLPDTIEKLRDFILIGREKLKAYKAKLNAIKIVGFAKEVRDQSLSDAQDMATALLWAESRMGELLKTSRSGSFRKGGEKELPDGITHKQSHYAQQLANHPDIVL